MNHTSPEEFANQLSQIWDGVASTGRFRAPAPQRSMWIVTMDAQMAEQLREGYNQLENAETLAAVQENANRASLG